MHSTLIGKYEMNKEVKSKKSDEFSYVAMIVSLALAFYVKKVAENSFFSLQELSFPMDLGFFLTIFIPLYYLISKATEWLYSYINDFNR